MKLIVNLRRAVRRWLLRRLQPCRQMVPLMSESFERPLALMERFKLRLHLLACVWCARYLSQLKMLRSLLQVSDSEPQDLDLPGSLPPSARARIAESIRQHRSNG